ncbi:WXG100 family type VII secretion target [Microbacterium sp. GXF7504]
MTKKISATEGALLRGAEAVSGAHADIAASTARVRNELEDLQSAWSGDAAKAYRELMTEWTTGANRINRTLVHLQEALRATHGDQVAVEDAHRQTISGLGSMMGGE